MFKWGRKRIITEEKFMAGIIEGSFDSNLVGRTVRLKEGDQSHGEQTHDWTIIRVNADSYDLWYNGSIGDGHMSENNSTNCWCKQSITPSARYLCTEYKDKLSDFVQLHLKEGLNANCGDDTVVILSAKQLGYTGEDISNDDNEHISYFKDESTRNTVNDSYWTTSTKSNDTDSVWLISSDGSFSNPSYYTNVGLSIVPAIRVGKSEYLNYVRVGEFEYLPIPTCWM